MGAAIPGRVLKTGNSAMGAEGQDMSVLRSLPALGVEDSTRLSVLPEAPDSLPGWKEVVLQGRSPEGHCWASDSTLASAGQHLEHLPEGSPGGEASSSQGKADSEALREILDPDSNGQIPERRRRHVKAAVRIEHPQRQGSLVPQPPPSCAVQVEEGERFGRVCRWTRQGEGGVTWVLPRFTLSLAPGDAPCL